MKRHTFALDLLRKKFDVHEELKTMGYKQELTQADFDLIIDNAEKIASAARIAKETLGRD